MFNDKITPYAKYFPNECAQIEFWDGLLAELSSQLTIFNNLVLNESDFTSSKNSFYLELAKNYYLSCQKVSNEPSNIFYLTQLIFSTTQNSLKIQKDKISSLKLDFSITIPELVSNISSIRKNILSISSKNMSEVASVMEELEAIKSKYKKTKTNLDEATLSKKKKEADAQNAYNITVKEKADKKVFNNVKEMENILPKMKLLKETLDKKRERFNALMKENFEIVVTNVFKNLCSVHQCFFLLSKNKFDCHSELIKDFRSTFHQYSSLSININEYTERKYAELQGIKFDSIEMINLSDDIYRTNATQLRSACMSVINYVNTFIKCTKIRKNVLKIFLKFHNEIMQFEVGMAESKEKLKIKFRNDILNMKMIGGGTLKSWRLLFENFFMNNLLIRKNSVNVEFDNCLVGMKNDLHQFVDSWGKYEKKLNELTSKSNEKHFEKNTSNIVAFLTEAVDFLKNKVPQIREKDIKRMARFVDLYAKNVKVYENYSERIVETSLNEINFSTSIDLFEECRSAFKKYFLKFSIENYENLMEKIKVKILIKTDFQKERLGKCTYEQMNDYSTVNNLSLDVSKEGKEVLLENEGKVQELKSNNSKEIKTTFSFFELNSASEAEGINFVKSSKFNEPIESKNPYQGIKEQDLQEYLARMNEKDENEEKRTINLAREEKIIDSFSCAYKDKILLQGKLYITTKKIIFNSKFNKKTILGGGTKLEIPLSDIIEVKKRSNLKIFPNSIEIQTEKNLLFFTSFLFRDRCYEILSSQLKEVRIQKINEENKKGGNANANANEPDLTGKKGKKHYIKKTQKYGQKILEMLKEIDFYNRLKEIHEARMNKLKIKFGDDPLHFIPPEEFKQTYIQDDLDNTPLYVVFNYIFNPETKLEQFESQDDFYTSIFKERGDYDIALKMDPSNPEPPSYFKDADYFLNLFTNFSKDELEGFLNEAENWSENFDFNLSYIHPIKKYFIGPDRLNLEDQMRVYFVSPLCLIVDDINVGSGFPFCDTFVNITQYQFDCDIAFNNKKGKFEFKTKCTIRFLVKFVKSCMFQGKISDTGYEEGSAGIKFYLYEKVKLVLEDERNSLMEMFEKINEENLCRKLIVMKDDPTLDEEDSHSSVEDEENDDDESPIVRVVDSLEGEEGEEKSSDKKTEKLKSASPAVRPVSAGTPKGEGAIPKLTSTNSTSSAEPKEKKANCNNSKQSSGTLKLIIAAAGILFIVVIGIFVEVKISDKQKIKETLSKILEVDLNVVFNLIVLVVILYILVNIKNQK